MSLHVKEAAVRDMREKVQRIINEIAEQEATFCKERGRNGGAIVVLLNPMDWGIESKMALARTIIRGATPLVYLVRFLEEALGHRNEYIATTRIGFFYIGIAGLSPFRTEITANRIKKAIMKYASAAGTP